MKEALFYRKLDDHKIRCDLCPHNCIISSGNIGICRARKNIDGILYSINYGKTISISIDPMEKKPLYHFHPGKSILSIGPNSCNFSCKFCQNYQSSQLEVPTTIITPGKLLDLCKLHLCDFVAFTYTEPTTWFEFMLDSSKLLKENGIKTVMVTNGFINQEPLKELLPYIDAMNIDLKAFDEKFYNNICNGSLQPVLETIKTASKQCHVEITNLIITDENDSEEQINDLVDFVASVNNEIPLHFSRYYPTYKMENPPTSVSTLEMAKQIAEQKLNYVYLGNIVTERNTYCPNCDHLLICRDHPLKNDIIDGKCPSCGHIIYGEF
ncbi:MAG: AmmeMemoRadiSam system radical SAM enzyme [Candidatus Cloacimonetes bacterium]|jgi:pyruvate formate lyase activating enzyme|nr:AmmeMemoRadiSam system radical SAM enzyme [Candidatus Cloacimonadota bacterium]